MHHFYHGREERQCHPERTDRTKRLKDTASQAIPHRQKLHRELEGVRFRQPDKCSIQSFGLKARSWYNHSSKYVLWEEKCLCESVLSSLFDLSDQVKNLYCIDLSTNYYLAITALDLHSLSNNLFLKCKLQDSSRDEGMTGGQKTKGECSTWRECWWPLFPRSRRNIAINKQILIQILASFSSASRTYVLRASL